MELRPLGAVGFDVSPLGLGTVKLGRNQAVKYPRSFVLPSDEEARDLLRLAADLGINLLDTAPAYGSSEKRLGALLAEMPGRFLLSTKVGEEFVKTSQGFCSCFDFSAAHTRASLERSLQRLRRDVLDIVLVHSDGRADDVPALEALHALADLKAEGKVRAIGMSPKTLAGARAALPFSDVLMLTLNAVDRAMRPVVREAHAAGVGVLIKKGFSSGHFVGQASSSDPIEAALADLLTEPGVSSVVVGTINPEHLRHNAAVAERILNA